MNGFEDNSKTDAEGMAVNVMPLSHKTAIIKLSVITLLHSHDEAQIFTSTYIIR